MKILRFDRLGSTQDYAKKYIGLYPTPFVILAEMQDDGKGRYGRRFISPKGGLYFTLVIDWENPLISMIVPLSIVEAIDEVGIRTEILWPNDIIYKNKKLGGILIEKIGEKSLIGIGINCNNKIVDFPEWLRDIITTIYEIKGEMIDIERLCVSIIEKIITFPRYIDVRELYIKRMKGKGEIVKIKIDEKEVVEGKIKGIGKTGGLLIERGGKVLEIKSAEKLFLVLTDSL